AELQAVSPAPSLRKQWRRTRAQTACLPNVRLLRLRDYPMESLGRRQATTHPSRAHAFHLAQSFVARCWMWRKTGAFQIRQRGETRARCKNFGRAKGRIGQSKTARRLRAQAFAV